MVLGSDYDGTLCRNGGISREDLEAITRWRAAGHLFGVISGRGYTSLYHEVSVRNHVPYDFLICNNGCAIYDHAGRLMADLAGDGAVLTKVVPAIIQAGGLHACISTTAQRIRVEYPGAGGHWDVTRTILPEQAGEIKKFNQIDTMFPTEQQAADFAVMVNQRFADGITAFQNGVCVDMVPPGVGKPEGLSQYLELMGLPPQAAVTVGDNYNDVGMLEAFGGYVVASASPEIQKMVGRVCGSIAELIQERMLSKAE